MDLSETDNLQEKKTAHRTQCCSCLQMTSSHQTFNVFCLGWEVGTVRKEGIKNSFTCKNKTQETQSENCNAKGGFFRI